MHHIFLPLSQKVDTTSNPMIGEGVNAPALLWPNRDAQFMDSNPSPVLAWPHAIHSWCRPVSWKADTILTAIQIMSVTGQEDILHNLHCFWQIRMVSVRSMTDSTYWSLPSRIIGSTKGLLTPGTRTGTRDTEFVTLTPRFDLSVFSLAAVVRICFTNSYISLLGTSAGCYCIVPPQCFLCLCQALYDSEQRTQRAYKRSSVCSSQSWYNSHSDTQENR